MDFASRPLVITAFLLAFAGMASADDKPVETALQGHWKLLSAKQNGGYLHVQDLDKLSLTVDKDEMTFTIDGTEAVQGAKFVLRPETAPPQFDFTRVTQDSKWNHDNPVTKLVQCWNLKEGNAVPNDKLGQGIYKVDGNKLTLCWRTTEGREIVGGQVSEKAELRPSAFQSHLYYHQILFQMERVK